MKKIYFGTNLKMYKNIQQTVDYLKTLANETAELEKDMNYLLYRHILLYPVLRNLFRRNK